MNCHVQVMPDAAGVAHAAAKRFVALARSAVSRQGRFRVALAGGGTPQMLHRLLAQEPYASRVPWARTHVYWGDERFLPPGDQGRNDTAVLPLLTEVGVPEENLHPFPFVEETPADQLHPQELAGACGMANPLGDRMDAAAQAYERLLAHQAEAVQPLLDLVLLGLGTDGHTASLFPGTPALDEAHRLVVPNRALYEDRFPQRLTLTFKALNACAAVIFLVTGSGKRQILARVLGPLEDPPLPAQRVAPFDGQLWWIVDREAAAGLAQMDSLL